VILHLELPNSSLNLRTGWSCSENWSLQKVQPKSSLRQCSYVFYALTFIGPRDANTGEPRDNVLTAILATMLPMSVFMITCLLDFAAFDKVLNPALRLPAKNDCAAAPAFTCEINARAVPVSITFIPKVLGALRLLLLRLRTMDNLHNNWLFNLLVINADALFGVPIRQSTRMLRTFPPWEGSGYGILGHHIPNNHGIHRKLLKVRKQLAPYLQHATLCRCSSPGICLSNRTTYDPY